MAKIDVERINYEWAMPSKWTFTIAPIKSLVNEEFTDGLWIDPFCGRYSPAQVRNDLDPSVVHAQTHLDALTFLLQQPSDTYDGAYLDPPYSFTKAAQLYKSFGKEKLQFGVANMRYWALLKDQLARVIKPGGKIISCGWSSGGLGKGRGFKKTRLLVVNHGGMKNDTLILVEKRIGDPIKKRAPLKRRKAIKTDKERTEQML